jgi:hypothetical protein
MVEDTHTKILRALAKLRGRQLTAQERVLLEWSDRLADAAEDVDTYGADVEHVAEGLADSLADFAKREREREAVEPEPLEVFSRETAAGTASPLVALSLLLAIEAEEREDVHAFRREHLAGGLLALLPRWIVVSGGRHFGDCEPDRGEWLSQVPPGAHEDLRGLSATLAADYTWTAGQSAYFVLAGIAPLLAGTVTTGRVHMTRAALTYIQVECSAITTPREVAAAYTAARRQLLGPRHRPLSAKHLALVAFGAEEQAARPRPTWEALWLKWNGEHPEWSYPSSHQLARDWRVARERVRRPPVR